MPAALTLSPDVCALADKRFQRVLYENITGSNMSVLPDRLWLYFGATDGWQEVSAFNEKPDGGSGGCPVPLEPGSACAIRGDLNDVWTLLKAGGVYTDVRVGWTNDDFDPVEEEMPEECEL